MLVEIVAVPMPSRDSTILLKIRLRLRPIGPVRQFVVWQGRYNSFHKSLTPEYSNGSVLVAMANPNRSQFVCP